MNTTMRRLGLLLLLALAAEFSIARAEDKTWTLRVCKPSTEASKVQVEIGPPGRDRSIRKDWAVWERAAAAGEVQEFDAPPEARGSQRIWVHAAASPQGRKAHLAVFFREAAKKVFDFEGEVSGDVSVEDPDADWRCTQ